MSNEPTLHAFGPHRLRMEPPDTIWILYNGVVQKEHLAAFFEVFEAIAAPYMIIVEDMSKFAEMATDTRRTILDHLPQYAKRIRSIISYGGTYRARIMISMLVKATNALGATGMKLHFVANEAEATEMLVKERQRLRQEHKLESC